MIKKGIRVVIARLGMDAHWRGSIVVARALRDAGMEVIYLGNQMPENIVEAAIQEDADVIGMSTLSGNHMILAPEVVRILIERNMNDIASLFYSFYFLSLLTLINSSNIGVICHSKPLSLVLRAFKVLMRLIGLEEL